MHHSSTLSPSASLSCSAAELMLQSTVPGMTVLNRTFCEILLATLAQHQVQLSVVVLELLCWCGAFMRSPCYPCSIEFTFMLSLLRRNLRRLGSFFFLSRSLALALCLTDLFFFRGVLHRR